jgi:hypothetical protein
MAVSGHRPEDMCDQRPYSGKAGIGCFGREMLLSSERGHSRAAAAAEERPDHFGGLRTDAASEVCGAKPGGEGYLEASPYVSVFRPDRGCEALQYQSAYLVGGTAARTAGSCR